MPVDPAYVAIGPRDDFKFDSDLAIGLFVVGLLGLISSLMAFCLFVCLVRDTLKHYNIKTSSRDRLQPISMIFMLAIFMDIFQGIGSVFDMHWALRGSVVDVGPHGDIPQSHSICTAQGVMQQFGNNGAAWCTIWIAILTLYHPHQNLYTRVTLLIVAQIFLFLILIIAIPATTVKSYYGDTGLWCWIQSVPDNHGDTREGLRIGSEYAFFWTAGAVSVGCYGYIIYRWLTDKSLDAEAMVIRRRNARAMGWWPIGYLVQIIPISIVRWIEFSNPKHHIARGWVVLVAAIFAVSGAINVTLWLVTGRRFGFSYNVSDSGSDPELGMRSLNEAAPHSESEVPDSLHRTTTGMNGASDGIQRPRSDPIQPPH